MKNNKRCTLREPAYCNKKAIIFYSIIALLTGICLGAAILHFTGSARDYTAFISMGCDASAYRQEEETGYLTIVYREKEINVKVDDSDLQHRLSEENPQNIIGVNLLFTLPGKLVREKHLPVEDLDFFTYLYNNNCDEYLVLQDVFYK